MSKKIKLYRIIDGERVEYAIPSRSGTGASRSPFCDNIMATYSHLADQATGGFVHTTQLRDAYEEINGEPLARCNLHSTLTILVRLGELHRVPQAQGWYTDTPVEADSDEEAEEAEEAEVAEEDVLPSSRERSSKGAGLRLRP